MVNWRTSQTNFGYHCSRTQRIRRRPLATSLPHALASSPQRTHRGISHNSTSVQFTSFCDVPLIDHLQDRIRDENPASRATVLAAIRYTFAENSQAYDEALSPVIMDFIGLISDKDLVCYTIQQHRDLLLICFVSDCPTTGIVRPQLCSTHEAILARATLVRDHARAVPGARCQA